MVQPVKHQADWHVDEPLSKLQHCWEQNGFAFTAQLPPLYTPQVEDCLAHARICDAVLTAYVSAGAVAFSSLAQAVLLQRAGIEAIVQLHGRDRNRIALQSDIVSLGALHLPNLLIDMQPVERTSPGPHADARLVAELDGPALLATAAMLRDEARFVSGARIKTPPVFYLGALVRPEDRYSSEELAPAQFLVTAPLSDEKLLATILARYADLLRTRPLLVSISLFTGSHDQHAITAGTDDITRLQAVMATIDKLKKYPAVRGFNIVVSHIADLALLKDLARMALSPAVEAE